MQLVSRAAWGARPSKNRQALDRSAQRGTAVHYTAADVDEQADHANCAKRVRSIQAFHMDGRGWSDIAYSYLPCKHGFVYEGRGRGIRTAANGTDAGNTAYHAVCFLGDDTAVRDDVTGPGREAIKAAVTHCNAWAGVGEVKPHSAFKATACPGDQLRAWVAEGMPLDQPPAEEDVALTPEQMKELKDHVTVMAEQACRRAVHAIMTGGTGQWADPTRTGWDFYTDKVRASATRPVATRVEAIESDTDALAEAAAVTPLEPIEGQVLGGAPQKLSPHEIAWLAQQAGWTGDDLRTAVAVCLAESTTPGGPGGDTTALGRSDTGASIGNFDHGLWQISGRWHGDKLTEHPDWRTPATNAALAFEIWVVAGRKWTPWAVFNSGAYEKYLPDADIALAAPFPVTP